jgi:hypothetical protein
LRIGLCDSLTRMQQAAHHHVLAWSEAAVHAGGLGHAP